MLLAGSIVLFLVAFSLAGTINPLLGIALAGVAMIGIGCGLSRLTGDQAYFNAAVTVAGLWFALYLNMIVSVVFPASQLAISAAAGVGAGYFLSQFLGGLACL